MCVCVCVCVYTITHTHINIHILYGMEIPKPHNSCFYVAEHNMGRIALENRIYITCFHFFKDPIDNTVELCLSGRWSFGSPIIRIGLALRINMSRILKN